MNPFVLNSTIMRGSSEPSYRRRHRTHSCNLQGDPSSFIIQRRVPIILHHNSVHCYRRIQTNPPKAKHLRSKSKPHFSNANRSQTFSSLFHARYCYPNLGKRTLPGSLNSVSVGAANHKHYDIYEVFSSHYFRAQEPFLSGQTRLPTIR